MLKKKQGTLTSADLVLLQKLDAADLRQYELAAELSVRLIQDWLVKYKFKDWSTHGTTKKTVTNEEKEKRAEEVAQALNDQERWGTHRRGINRDVLSELKLKIDDLDADPDLSRLIKGVLLVFQGFCCQGKSEYSSP